jgi:peptidyl-prolyl cis-trans isomerase SurA
MRRLSLLLLAWLPLAGLVQAAPPRQAAQPVQAAPPAEMNRVVAVVNNDVILKSELDQRIKTVQAQLKRRGGEVPPEPALRRQVLERLVLERLQLQLAEKSGIRVSDDQLNEAMARLAQQNNVSVAQFRSTLEREGYDFRAFREQIRNELVIGELRRKQVENRVQVTEREVENTLLTAASQAGAEEEYRLAQLLVAVPEGASPDQLESARQRAVTAREEIRGGADFQQVATARSDDPMALEGSDLGWRKVDQLPGAIAEAVVRLKPGQVSEPIRGANGYYLVKLLEVRRGQRLVVTQTRARHILIRPDKDRTEDAVRTRLEQLRRRILSGEGFAELARANSADAPSAARGGDLGWINPGDVAPEFERVASTLAPGEVSQPFRTPYGWHIVQVVDRRQHDSTEEIRRARARDYVRKRKVEEETQAWLRRLRDEAFVEYRSED